MRENVFYIRSFVRYCGQGSSLLWTPALFSTFHKQLLLHISSRIVPYTNYTPNPTPHDTNSKHDKNNLLILRSNKPTAGVPRPNQKLHKFVQAKPNHTQFRVSRPGSLTPQTRDVSYTLCLESYNIACMLTLM